MSFEQCLSEQGNNAAHKFKIQKVCFQIWMTWIGKKKKGITKGITFTISIFSICQERWYCDNALLSYTHSQETLVHTRNQPSNSHVGIVSSHPIMAKHEKEKKITTKCQTATGKNSINL